MEKELTTDNTYGSIERRLRDEGFDVISLHRDQRGDWGDDGGFIIAICQKNEHTYLHILSVNYNADVGTHVLDENDERLSLQNYNEIRDFMVCEDVNDAQYKLNLFLDDLDEGIRQEEEEDGDRLSDFYHDWDEFPEYLQKYNPDERYYLAMLSSVYSSYAEGRKDRDILIDLQNTPYVPDYRCDYAVQDEE